MAWLAKWGHELSTSRQKQTYLGGLEAEFCKHERTSQMLAPQPEPTTRSTNRVE